MRASAPLVMPPATPAMARVSSRANVRRFLEAALWIGVPMLVGMVFYLANAPDSGAGVFVETDHENYALPARPAGTPQLPSDGRTAAAVLADGAPRSLYVVGFQAPAGGPKVKLYALVVDNADPEFQSEVVPIAAEVHQLNGRAYRVTSPQLALWGPDVEAFKLYDRVLATHAGSRTTMEAAIGLEIEDGNGLRQVFTLRVGPR